jgi:hypothetical protein
MRIPLIEPDAASDLMWTLVFFVALLVVGGVFTYGA